MASLGLSLGSGCALHPLQFGGGSGASNANDPMANYVAHTYSYNPELEARIEASLEPRMAANAQNQRTPRAKPPEHNFLTNPVAWGKLMSKYGFRVNPTGNHEPRKHNGIDYAAPIGTEVFAAGDGVIEYRYVSKSYGNYLRIRHANGFHRCTPI